MTAYVGFGWSYGGKWFAGFAKPNDNVPGGRDLGPYGGTMRKARLLRERDAIIVTGEWDSVTATRDAVCYYDPPYLGKTKQHRGVSYIPPLSIARHSCTGWAAAYASEFGNLYGGRVVLDMGNTDMLVNGGEKKNNNELLVRIF